MKVFSILWLERTSFFQNHKSKYVQQGHVSSDLVKKDVDTNVLYISYYLDIPEHVVLEKTEDEVILLLEKAKQIQEWKINDNYYSQVKALSKLFGNDNE